MDESLRLFCLAVGGFAVGWAAGFLTVAVRKRWQRKS